MPYDLDKQIKKIAKLREGQDKNENYIKVLRWLVKSKQITITSSFEPSKLVHIRALAIELLGTIDTLAGKPIPNEISNGPISHEAFVDLGKTILKTKGVGP